MFCVMCRAENPAQGHFCWECGAELVRAGGVSDPQEMNSATLATTSQAPPSAQPQAVSPHSVEAGELSLPRSSSLQQDSKLAGREVPPLAKHGALPVPSGRRVDKRPSATWQFLKVILKANLYPAVGEVLVVVLAGVGFIVYDRLTWPKPESIDPLAPVWARDWHPWLFDESYLRAMSWLKLKGISGLGAVLGAMAFYYDSSIKEYRLFPRFVAGLLVASWVAHGIYGQHPVVAALLAVGIVIGYVRESSR